MNREIKFRAWDTKNSAMFYPDEDDKTNFSRIVDGDRIGSDFNYNDLFDGLDRGLAPLQYVGLKDKNGEEIWEGDVVKIPLYGNTVIVWNENVFSFQYSYHAVAGKGVTNTLYRHEQEKYQVIGNIYENPNLKP